jgi:hypothetical protein
MNEDAEIHAVHCGIPVSNVDFALEVFRRLLALSAFGLNGAVDPASANVRWFASPRKLPHSRYRSGGAEEDRHEKAISVCQPVLCSADLSLHWRVRAPLERSPVSRCRSLPMLESQVKGIGVFVAQEVGSLIELAR